MIIHVTMPGNPMPCPRPRVANNRAYYPAAYEHQKQAWGLLGCSQVNGSAFGRGERLSALLLFRRADRRRADGDNLAKALTDSLNKIAYDDDAQIDRWVIDIQRGAGDDAGADAYFYAYMPRREFVHPTKDNWAGV